MLIAAVIAFCFLLLVVAFLAPRLSRHLQKGGDAPLAGAQKVAGTAPGKLGDWLQKPFGKSRKAVRKSGAAGRKGRAKTPV